MFRMKWPEAEIVGITLSSAEAQLAQSCMEEVHVADLEATDFAFLGQKQFDLMVFSHVLEHLRYPDSVLRTLSERIKCNGHILIAAPNVLQWRNRLRMIRGIFDYEDSGVMDRTHLRFFTWHTIDRFLLKNLMQYELITKHADGAVPLWVFRRILPSKLVKSLDQYGSRAYPNLFGNQIILLAQRRHSAQHTR